MDTPRIRPGYVSAYRCLFGLETKERIRIRARVRRPPATSLRPRRRQGAPATATKSCTPPPATSPCDGNEELRPAGCNANEPLRRRVGDCTLPRAPCLGSAAAAMRCLLPLRLASAAAAMHIVALSLPTSPPRYGMILYIFTCAFSELPMTLSSSCWTLSCHAIEWPDETSYCASCGLRSPGAHTKPLTFK